MLLLAKDGVYLPTAPRAVEQGLLASGNRADVLINCPPGDTWTFASAKLVVDGKPKSGVIETVLLHINSVVDKDAPQQCDLPVFEVNRPCCDRPPFEPGTQRSAHRTSADPVFASCFGQTSSTCAARRRRST